MNHEYEHSRASSPPAAAPHHEALEPGQSSRSALLRKPEHPVASGLVQRKARDANGVADGAEQAVSAASSSSGSPLPSTLMRQFETSLGADLSGVRVHTGGASAYAADAVGAKAYTMGNDIHFGAGHYDPSSSSGQHLLAHEVAHTVQQSGGMQRMQYKLEVSSPDDSLEHEADRAADAMLSEQLATTVPAPPVRTIQRQVVDAGTAPWSTYLPFAKGKSFKIDGPWYYDGNGVVLENRPDLLSLRLTIRDGTLELSYSYKADGSGNTASMKPIADKADGGGTTAAAKSKEELISDSNVTIHSSAKTRVIQLSKPIALGQLKIDRVSFSAVDANNALMILRVDGTERNFDLKQN